MVMVSESPLSVLDQPVGIGDLFCIVILNFVEIGRSFVKTMILLTLKWRLSAMLDFQTFIFFCSVRFGGSVCITMPNFIEIILTAYCILTIFQNDHCQWRPSVIRFL